MHVDGFSNWYTYFWTIIQIWRILHCFWACKLEILHWKQNLRTYKFNFLKTNLVLLQGMFFTLLSILYVAIFIRESRGPYSEFSDKQLSYDFSGVFSFWNVRAALKACFKSRNNYVRPILILLILSMLYHSSTNCKQSFQFNYFTINIPFTKI